MAQWREMTTVVDKKTGKLSHGENTNGKAAQMADNMGPLRQYSTPSRDGPKRATERTKKRRKREVARAQDDGPSSLPLAKKARTGNPSSQDATFEYPPLTLDITNTHLFSPSDHAEVERHISPSLMKSLVITYEVTSMNIISSSKIQSKVRAIIEKLGSFSFVAATKPNIVLLHAKGAVSSKLITIIEITKREVAKAGGKWYQYNVLGQILAPQETKSATMKGTGFTLGSKPDAGTNAMEVDDKEHSQTIDEEESVFETMKTPLERAIEGKPKVHAIPVFLIFLSRVRNNALKGAYG
jgi:hypothetical protein